MHATMLQRRPCTIFEEDVIFLFTSFLIFVNDLPNIALSTAKLFADDTKLYRQIKNIRDCDILQEDLNEFSAWSKIWLINFNALKCIVLRIRDAIRYIYIL